MDKIKKFKKRITDFMPKTLGRFMLAVNNIVIAGMIGNFVWFALDIKRFWSYFSFWLALCYVGFIYFWIDWLGNSILETSQNKLNDKNEG